MYMYIYLNPVFFLREIKSLFYFFNLFLMNFMQSNILSALRCMQPLHTCTPSVCNGVHAHHCTGCIACARMKRLVDLQLQEVFYFYIINKDQTIYTNYISCADVIKESSVYSAQACILLYV